MAAVEVLLQVPHERVRAARQHVHGHRRGPPVPQSKHDTALALDGRCGHVLHVLPRRLAYAGPAHVAHPVAGLVEPDHVAAAERGEAGEHDQAEHERVL